MKQLRFENIDFRYNKNTPIFENLNFQIESDKGYVVALMGSSGSGKSTLFKLILENERPQKGNILFHTNNPVIAYLPQEPVLFEHLTPMQNARYFQRSSYYAKYFNEELFLELANALNIQDVLIASKSILELSGGQRQRLMLLRSLVLQPDIVLLDEPTTGLDASVKIQFLNKLREIVLKYKLLVIYITHHKLESELIADEIFYLKAVKNSPAKLYRKDISEFIQSPPLLEGMEVFAYPKPNILWGKQIGNFIMPTDDKNDNDAFYIGVREENIAFRDDGIEYTIITENSINTTIYLNGSKQPITLNTQLFNEDKYHKILLIGKFNLYNADGELIKTISI